MKTKYYEPEEALEMLLNKKPSFSRVVWKLISELLAIGLSWYWFGWQGAVIICLILLVINLSKD